MSCLHVRVFATNTVRAVQRKEYLNSRIIYHLCDSIGKYLGYVTDQECEIVEV